MCFVIIIILKNSSEIHKLGTLYKYSLVLFLLILRSFLAQNKESIKVSQKIQLNEDYESATIKSEKSRHVFSHIYPGKFRAHNVCLSKGY